MISVCWECKPPIRHPACHDTCPKYQAAKAEDIKLKQKIKAENKGFHELTKYYSEKKTKRIKKFGDDVW